MKKLHLAGILLLFSTIVFSQKELKGKVTDGQGNPLPGASIVVLETKQGAVTDEAGHYSFTLKKGGEYTLRASYVGFEETTATVDVLETAETVLLDFRLYEKPVLLETLTVQATRAGGKMPFTYETLKKEQLKSRNLGQDVPYLLDATPSVVVTSDAGAGIGYTGIRIRGSDPTRINVTINGIPLNDAESQNVFWVDLPDFAASTQDIQIQRGVGTSTNGAGAFGATINLNSSSVNPEAYGEFAGTIGSFGTKKASAQFGTGFTGKKKLSGFTLDGRLSRIVSDGYIERASVDLKSFYLSATYVGDNSSLRANVFSGHEVTYQAWNGVPAQWENDEKLRRYNVSGTEKPGTPHDNEVDDYTQTHYQLLFNRELNRRWYVNLAGHYTKGYGFFEQYKTDEERPRYGLPEPAPCPDTTGACAYDFIRRRWLDNHFFGGTWALHYLKLDRGLQATFGGAWNHYLGDHFGELIWGENLLPEELGFRYYDGKGDKQDFNVFAKIQYRLATALYGFIDLQYRRVSHDIDGTDNSLRDVTNFAAYHFFNPKLGLTYDLGKNASCYASFAVANREPNRDDFTEAPKGTTPKPERLYNTEAGFQLRLANATVSLNFFHMLYKDQLVLTGNINDVGAAIRCNVPDSYRTGIELAGSMVLRKGLRLEANAMLSRNKIRQFTEYIDNWDTWEQEAMQHGTTDIAFSPGLVSFGRLSCNVLERERHRLTLAIAGKYVGRQFIDNTSNTYTVLDAYTLGECQIRYVLKPAFVEELSFNLLINNLFDARYSSNAWTYRYTSTGYDGRRDDPYTRLEQGNVYNLTGFFPQAGRNFLAGLTVRF
jgi:iron complex outermembrane receptor protein